MTLDLVFTFSDVIKVKRVIVFFQIQDERGISTRQKNRVVNGNLISPKRLITIY